MNESFKIGMVTFFRDNYGAFLQAYASQQVWKLLGCYPELIDYDDRKEKSILGTPLLWLRHEPKRFFLSLIASIIKFPNHKRRNKQFSKDIAKYLLLSKVRFKKYKKVQEFPFEYDLCVTGSDQMFNPRLREQGFKFRMLEFAKCPIASYSASCGYERLDAEFLPYFQGRLPLFSGLSLREKSLATYINDSLGIDAFYHIDPSLLLTPNDWRKMSSETNYGQYIFFYVAGMQKGFVELVNEFSVKLGLPVLVADKDYKVQNQVKRRGYLKPSEWVDALDKAAYVVTNSFHGTAFCINFHKKAFVLATGVRSERMQDLIKNCKLERLFSKDIITDDEVAHLYDYADDYLESERKRSIDYFSGLKNSLI